MSLDFTYRHNDDQTRWHVGVKQVIAETSLQHEHDFEASEITWKLRRNL